MTEPAIRPHDAAPRTIASDVLGTLDVAPDQLIEFPAGLLGFPEVRRFVLVPAAREGAWWLQSAEYGALAFLVVDPFLAVDGFSVDVPDGMRASLGIAAAADVMVLAIATLPSSPAGQPTLNLQAPLVFNVTHRRAAQMVDAEGRYGLREPFAVERLGKRPS